MPSNIVETILKLRGARQFQREADASAKSIGRIGTESETAGKNASGGFRELAKWGASTAAISGAGLFMKQAVGAAVDLNEEINKTGVVFRQAAPQLLEFSKSAATSLGMSQQEALAAMGTFGNMLVPMGFARDRAGEMSQNMVKLAADMASFNNASPADTLDALRAGLAGESEPLRRYGVFLNDARLKQQAMSMGLYSGKGVLDANAKAQATYALILKDTKDAQGDFSRTSDSLANKQRILKAQFTDTSAELGANLLPVATRFATILSELAKHTTLLYTVIGLLTTAFLINRGAALVASLAQLGFTRAMISTRIATLLTTLAMMGLNLSMLLIPLAIAAIVIGLYLLWTKCAWFRDALKAAWGGVVAAFNAVKNAAIATFNWIKTHWPLLLAILTGPLGLATYGMAKHWDAIKKGASDAVRWIADRFRALIAFVKRIPGAIVNAVKSAPGAGLNALKSVVPGMQHGGVVQRGGVALVGEAGPELVALPRAAQVFPSPHAAVSDTPSLEATHMQPVQLVVDGRVLADVVARVTSDKRARR